MKKFLHWILCSLFGKQIVTSKAGRPRTYKTFVLTSDYKKLILHKIKRGVLPTQKPKKNGSQEISGEAEFLSEQFFKSEEEEIGVGDTPQISPEQFDFGIE